MKKTILFILEVVLCAVIGAIIGAGLAYISNYPKTTAAVIGIIAIAIGICEFKQIKKERECKNEHLSSNKIREFYANETEDTNKAKHYFRGIR